MPRSGAVIRLCRAAAAAFVIVASAATAVADGFFAPATPPPERVADLDALCARLEDLGMPAVPPDADWICCPEKRMWPDTFLSLPDGCRLIPFFRTRTALRTDGNAWRWRPGPDAPACVLSVHGDLLSASGGFRPEELPAARLGRAIAGLRARLDARPPDPETAVLGPVVLFCAQLHRHGRSGEASGILDILDGAGCRAEAEASASNVLGRAALLALLRSPVRMDDPSAFAAALEENLARFPDACTGSTAARDPRPGLLAALRDAPGRPVPGVPPDLQELARALDRASFADLELDALGPDGKKLHPVRDLETPWLLPAAWTNALPVPDNAVWRLRALGPRALDVLLPMRRDKTLVAGRWFGDSLTDLRFGDGPDGKLVATRADAAADLLMMGVLPFRIHDAWWSPEPDRKRDAALRALVSDADDEDVFLLYLPQRPALTPWHVLAGWQGVLLAWFAERAADGPLPKVEARLEEIVRAVPLRETPPGRFDSSPQAALCFALFYAAVRGEAAAPFRDRVLEALRAHAAAWEPPSGKIPLRDALDRDCGSVLFEFEDVDFARRRGRLWYAKWAEAFEALPLGPSDPAALRARAAGFADWLRCAALVDSDGKPLFRPGLDAVPPAPPLLHAIAERFPKPKDLKPPEERKADRNRSGEAEDPDAFTWGDMLHPPSENGDDDFDDDEEDEDPPSDSAENLAL